MRVSMAKNAILFCAVFTLVAISPTPWTAPVEARGLRGRIVITKRKPPFRFRGRGHMMRFLRKYRVKHLWPRKTNKKQWKFEFMAFFKRATRDVQVKVKFFDITSAPKRFLAGDSIYLSSRKQKILSSNMVLEKPRFQVNRKIQMYITNSRNVVLAKTRFWLRGKGERYSGRVTFSDKEAK